MATRNQCAKCEENRVGASTGDTEGFIYTPHAMYVEHQTRILLDVEKAYALAEERNLQPTHADSLRDVARLIANVELCAEHVRHVPLTPGLVVTFKFHKKGTGEGETVFAIADGNHRAARCVREGRPFRFYYLDAEATKLISEHYHE